jgi:co-chaperonin GroES (HSP10)
MGSPPTTVITPKSVQNFTEDRYWDTSFTPLHDFVLLEKIVEHVGMIVIPDSVIKNSQVTIVRKIGPGGRMPNGEVNFCSVQPGDKVYIKAGNYEKFETESKRTFFIVHDSAILGKFETPKEPEPQA